MSLLTTEERASRARAASLARQPRVRSAQATTVIEVITVEGAHEQTEAGDLIREVTYFYKLDGTLIARLDPDPEART